MREIRYREAVREALAEELARDPRVFVMGEEVGHYNGAYKVTEGLLARFGDKRIVDAPIAEAGFAGIGVGAAMVGLRPVIEFMTWNFSAVAFDQILNNAAKLYQMSGGQYHVPIVFRGPNGAARQVAAQHSHSMDPFYVNIPGLYVVAPSTPRDAKGLLKTAIRDDNPVIFLEGETLYSVKGEVPDADADECIPLGRARIARAGDDVTLVGWGPAVLDLLAAAETLQADHAISAEVIDLRSLVPLDMETVLTSVRKTGRCVVASQAVLIGSFVNEIVARVQLEAFDYLDGPVGRIGAANGISPQAEGLERAFLPNATDVVSAVLALV
mgnify:CR=1 FL=1